MTPTDIQRLGWVDEALNKLGEKRNIAVFTRHYQAAILLAQQDDLIFTLPTLAAQMVSESDRVAILEPPFEIPRMRLQMVWSPLLQHDPGHKWMRQLIKAVSEDFIAKGS